MIQVIPPQSGKAFVLKKGCYLKVIDPQGSQVSDLFCVDQNNLEHALSSNHSIDYNDTIYLTKGHKLYSNQNEVMMEILEDTCGKHDFLMPPCSLKMFHIVSNSTEYHPSCHENLVNSLKIFKVPDARVATAFNIFMNVDVDPQGRLQILPPKSRAGDAILFKAHMDLIVALTACSHEDTNGGTFKPIEFVISDQLIA